MKVLVAMAASDILAGLRFFWLRFIMQRFISLLAVICVLMVVIAGSSAFLLSKRFIKQSKADTVSVIAKGVPITLSEQVNLLNSVLDKMVQDPEIINAARNTTMNNWRLP
jgi:uncharacterized membrane protein affecting hemolysin expression